MLKNYRKQSFRTNKPLFRFLKEVKALASLIFGKTKPNFAHVPQLETELNSLTYLYLKSEVEHPIPKGRGGNNTLERVAWSCGGCNRHKGTKVEGRDPVTGELIPLYNPRTQNWSDHFKWSDNFTVVIGVTPTGRATVNELKLNREGVVNLRRVLYEMGAHPPIGAV